MPNHKNYPCKLTYNHGISLIECMIASILGIFLLFGVIEVCISIKTTYYLQQSLTRIQENGRYAIYFLNQNIRMAGYKDCDEKLHGYSSKQLPEFLRNSRILANSDVIVIDRCDGNLRKKTAYFIARALYKKVKDLPVYSLYEKTVIEGKGSEPAQEVVSNIENMQISYGISTDGKNIYTYEKLPKNWQEVRSVEIALWLTADKLQKEWHTYITLREN